MSKGEAEKRWFLGVSVKEVVVVVRVRYLSSVV